MTTQRSDRVSEKWPCKQSDQLSVRNQAWVLVGEGKLAGKLGLSSKGLGPGGIVQAAKGHVLALFGTDADTPYRPCLTTTPLRALRSRSIQAASSGGLALRGRQVVPVLNQHQVLLDFQFDGPQSGLKLFLARELAAYLFVLGVGVFGGH